MSCRTIDAVSQNKTATDAPSLKLNTDIIKYP